MTDPMTTTPGDAPSNVVSDAIGAGFPIRRWHAAGATIDEIEKLAGEFLAASNDLRDAILKRIASVSHHVLRQELEDRRDADTDTAQVDENPPEGSQGSQTAETGAKADKGSVKDQGGSQGS